MRADCVVVGGGIAAAVSAYKARGSVVVVAPANDIGGKILSTITPEGFTIESGANTLVMTKEIQQLLAATRLHDKVLRPALKSVRHFVWSDRSAGIEEVPKSPPALIKSKLVSWRGKMELISKILRSSSVAKRCGWGAGAKQLTVREFTTQLVGEEFTNALVDPMLQGIFGGRIDQLLAHACFPKLVNALLAGESVLSYAKGAGKRELFVLAGGNVQLVQETLRVSGAQLVDDTVVGIHRDGQDFVVSCTSGQQIVTGKVVITTAGEQTAQVIEGLGESACQQALRQVLFAPVVVLSFSSPQPPPLERAFGVLYPSTQAQGIMGVMFNSTLFPALAPAGQYLYTVCIGGVGREFVLGMTDAELIARGSEVLASQYKITSPRSLKIQKWGKGIVQLDRRWLAAQQLLADVEDKYQKKLVFSGLDQGGVGVPERVRIAGERW